MARDTAAGTVDSAEIERFSAMAAEWWDASGPMAALHKLNPVRLGWIKDEVARTFGRDLRDPQALSGLRLLDVGCGAGIVSEPLRRLGAEVTAIDPAERNIEIARAHAAEGGLDIDYRATTAEALAEAGESYDIVTALEVVEHVTDVPAFVGTCASMVKPGGLMVAATINRTLKAYLLAIVGAEYVLRWVPRGTHQYEKLVAPRELEAAFRAGGLTLAAETGVMYVPVADRWRLSSDMDVNYMMAAVRKPARRSPQ
jgi:2-polyprenyl-6-hydroxyphenyl methylase/3-demethylubiquinone-9 3-methyltransferase